MIKAMRNVSLRPCYWCWLAVPLLVLLFRIAGPSDLHRKDQPRTVSYTVDMLVNGHWLLPADCEGVPAQKPPLYNWIGAPLLNHLPAHEWVLKLPTILAFLAVVGMLWVYSSARLGPQGGAIAVTAFSVNTCVLVLAYTARPDMLQAAFILGALLLSLQPDSGRWHWRSFLLWLLVAAAALTKGPAALLVPLFIGIRAFVFPGIRSHWALRSLPLGLAAAVILFALWAAPAWSAYPAAARQSFLDIESKRIGGHWLQAFIGGLWKMPFYFVARFLPWSLAVLVLARYWKKLNPPEAVREAILWISLVIGFFSLVAMKRDDYLLPAYPLAAFIAAWLVLQVAHKFPKLPSLVLGLGLGYLILNGSYALWLRDNDKYRNGDNCAEFASRIQPVVGSDKIAFITCGYNPLQALLRHNQSGRRPTRSEWDRASWVIMPVSMAPSLPGMVAQSKPIPQVIRRTDPDVLGLWPKADLPPETIHRLDPRLPQDPGN